MQRVNSTTARIFVKIDTTEIVAEGLMSHFKEAAIASSLFFAATRSSCSLSAFLLVAGNVTMLGGPSGEAALSASEPSRSE